MGGSLEESPEPPIPPPAEEVSVRPSGGFPSFDRPRRGRKEISEARRRFGLRDSYQDTQAAKVIANVAARQAQALEQDELKRLEELTRQLEIEGLEFDRRYLAALNSERQRLVDEEIAQRLQKKIQVQREEEELMILMMVAANS
jgi:hypothetical protein